MSRPSLVRLTCCPDSESGAPRLASRVRACFDPLAESNSTPVQQQNEALSAGPSESLDMSNNCWAFAFSWLFLCASSPEISAASSGVPRSSGPYIVDVKETEDGLPQNSVITITQTRDGYLWLGTLYGLVRFDGIRFTVFDESNTPGLNSGRIVFLFEDSQSNFWIGTETAGVVLVKDGQVKSLDIGRGSREGRLMSACEDADGAVWLYTADGQLCRHRNGRVDVWSVGADRFSNCRVVVAEKSGPLWVGTDRGLTSIGPTAALDPRELPFEKTVSVDKLDFLLASRRAGYWRLANGHVEKCRTDQVERDWGPYPWSSTARVSTACEDLEGNLLCTWIVMIRSGWAPTPEA